MKYKSILHGFLFTTAGIIVTIGIFIPNTWQIMAGYWMMMYVIEKIDKED